MTPAVRALEKAGVTFQVHEFEHVAGSSEFGREAADALGVAAARVFKTLVVLGDDRPSVAIVPVTGQLSLKAAARALGAKRATMCDSSVAERVTGYVVGGISPFGQRKRLPTVLDASAEAFDTIFVSGGRRGLDLELAAADVVALLGASVAAIAAP